MHVEAVVELALDAAALRDTTVVAIDGRSGAGKTTLASGVSADLRSCGTAALVHMDQLYPGWDGLGESSEILATRILEPISQGRPAAYAHWDWEAGGWGATVVLEPTDFLVIDGGGSSVGPARPFAAVCVFVDADPMLRMSRGLARDGDTYRPHWGAGRRRRRSSRRTTRGPARTSSSTPPGAHGRPGGTGRRDQGRRRRRAGQALPSAWVTAVALLAVAGNLRTVITSVPPLIDAISSDLGLSHAAAGALTTLPVLCMGVFAPLASAIAHRLGAVAAILAAMARVVVGTGSRWFGDDVATLYLGTFVAGVGSPSPGRSCPASSRRSSHRSASGSSPGCTCSP